MLTRPLFVLLLLTLLTPARPSPAQPIRAVQFSSGPFAHPILATAPPGDTSRLFVVDQGGSIWIVSTATGAVNATPFLTIPNVYFLGESGLLGLAFHPNFANNGLFYVYYSKAATSASPTGRMIERYQVSGNPDVAAPSSAATIFFFPASLSIHNGGWTAFGPDGHLYVAWGNQGNLANSPLLTTPLGKILRLDINGPDGVPLTADDDQFPGDPDRNFCIPPDNPFAGTANEQTIWAYGLRNPWRDTFDRATGEMYLADVGDATWEELNLAPPPPAAPGRNYGYPCMEGAFCRGSTTDTSCACNTPALTPPIYAYSHSFGCAIIGGYVYRGCAMPWLNGLLFFGDYCSRRIWTGRAGGPALMEVTERTSEVWGTTPFTFRSFGEDARGELYLCVPGSSTGSIYKLVPATLPDCNNNAVADGCDLAAGTSQDINHNRVPDECENPPPCHPCDADFNQDGDTGTDADIQSFFDSIAGHGPFGADFNADGDIGTDADIESFFRVLGGGAC